MVFLIAAVSAALSSGGVSTFSGIMFSFLLSLEFKFHVLNKHMKRDWKNFLLNLFFWVFAWTLIDTTFDLLKLTPEQTILICVAGLVLTSSLITRLD